MTRLHAVTTALIVVLTARTVDEVGVGYGLLLLHLDGARGPR
jgi:hypothetical protein